MLNTVPDMRFDFSALNAIRESILNENAFPNMISADELRTYFDGGQGSSGTRPCTSCCTQCPSPMCCLATYNTDGIICPVRVPFC